MYELGKTNSIEWHFLNGPVEVAGAKGIAEHYEGPYYRYFDSQAPHINQATGIFETLSEQATSPEDFSRSLRKIGLTDLRSSNAYDFLQQYLEQHDGDPFDRVLGFSEGASITASLLLRHSTEIRPNPFKFAVFICGFGPARWDCNDIILADETVKRINIPTAHIVGSKDCLYLAGRVLYNLYNQPYTSIFDYRGTHTIP